MVKRAVCVGCNYPSKPYGLAGCVNDAFLIAGYLEEHLGFSKENICVLHDVLPGKRRNVQVDEEKRPTRVNILQKLQWLVRSTKPGDVCFFSFSGYGLQVDDVDTMPDEGLDEAVLPTDYQEGPGHDITVIVGSEIHDLLAGVPPQSSVTIVMDCDHATSIADVTGTLNGELIAGLKETAYCGMMKAHTLKVEPSTHRREIWLDESSRQVKARPRFQPTMEVIHPTKGRFPTRPAMSRSNPVAFCFSASAHGQTAVELQVTVAEATWSTSEERKQHGVLSWCFVEAMKELRNDCTYLQLLEEMQRQLAKKRKEVPRLDQETLLTFTPPLSEPTKMKVLQPMQAKPPARPSGSLSVAPPVVPPPPPGFIGGSGVQPGNPGKSVPLRERTGPPSPPRFSSVPVETPPSKPTSSRSPILGRRNGAGHPQSQMSSNRSMTSLLAPLSSLGLFDGWSSLAGWFSYEPPVRPAEKDATSWKAETTPPAPSISPLLHCRATPILPDVRDDPLPPMADFSPLQPPPRLESTNGLRQASLSPPFQFRPDPSPQRPHPHPLHPLPPSSGGLAPAPPQRQLQQVPQVQRTPSQYAIDVQKMPQQRQPSQISQISQISQLDLQASQASRPPQHAPQMHSHQPQLHSQYHQQHSQSYYPVNYFASKTDSQMQFISARPNAEPPISWRRQPPTPLSRYRVAEQPKTAPIYPTQPMHSNSRLSRPVQHVTEPPMYWQCSQAWQAPHGGVVRRTGGDSLLRESVELF